MGNANPPLGLYVHFPFCESKCPYCDFVSFAGIEDAGEYFDLLESELALWVQSQALSGRELASIYFGGGTPSRADPSQVGQFIEVAAEQFQFAEEIEITLEANPHSSNLALFRELHQTGVNRLSVGVQSLGDRDLKALGRLHTAKDALASIAAAREAGFSNVSLDLIFGIPGQSLEQFLASLQGAIDLKPQHFSVYGLTVYEGTEFHRRMMAGELHLPSDAIQTEMFLAARRCLMAAGYEHYEISNYALEGFASRHNRLYWNGGEWLGLGVAAHSSLCEKRWENPESLEEWQRAISQGRLCSELEEPPTNDAALGEFVMLGLRQAKGVSLQEIEQRFGFETGRRVQDQFDLLLQSGHVIADGPRRALSESGFLVADSIMSRFF